MPCRGVVPTPVGDLPGVINPDGFAGTGNGLKTGDETSPLQRPTLGRVVAYYKYQTTKQVNSVRDSVGVPLWQRNYYEHIIRNEEEHKRIHAYITSNPIHLQEGEENSL
jgi:hypothetical protein